MRIKKIAALVLIYCIFLSPVIVFAKGEELSEKQKEVATKVAEKASCNWEEYGVLPSVAVVQAFNESSLGTNQVKPNNLWGIRPRGVYYSSYRSLDDGIMAYLRVINNGYYGKALYKRDYHKQLRHILAGGYYGEDDGGTIEEYYQNCIGSIEKYGFDKYDKVLFDRLKEKSEQKRIRKWDKTYTLHYDDSLEEHEISADKKIINGGAVEIWKDKELKGIYDVAGGQKGLNIGISDLGMDGIKVKIIVREEAKG